MYFTANGRALPCCIAPFSQRGYENYTLGDATQQTLARNLDRPGLRRFPQGAQIEHAAGGLRQLRIALEPVAMPPQPARVAVVIPTFNEAESIAAVDRRIAARYRRPGDRGRRRQQRRHARPRARRRRRGHRGRPRLRPGLPRRRAGGRRTPTSSSSWMATAPTIRPPSRRWWRRSAPAMPISSSPRARAAQREAGSMASHQLLAGLIAGVADATALRRALHRHVRVPRHPPRHLAGARHARNDLWLESRNADAGGARRPCASLELPVAYRRRLGGESKVAGSLRGSLKRRRENHLDLRPRGDGADARGARPSRATSPLCARKPSTLPRRLSAAFSTAADAVSTVSAELCMSAMAPETRCSTATTDRVPDRGRRDVVRNFAGRRVLLLDRAARSRW